MLHRPIYILHRLTVIGVYSKENIAIGSIGPYRNLKYIPIINGTDEYIGVPKVC